MKLIIPFLLISFFIAEISIANGLLEEESDDSTTKTSVKKPSKSGEAMVNKEESEDSDVFYDEYEEAEDQELVSDVKEDDLSDDANQADEIKTKQSAVKKNEKKMENKKWWQFWK